MMGKVIMSGIVPPLVAPVTGLRLGDIAVGSSVYLMENGTAVEYLVVNQGVPSGSSLYDASCNGTWLVRKNIYKKTIYYNTSDTSAYKGSNIHKYLNGTFYNTFDDAAKSAIKEAIIPYISATSSGTVSSGANGLKAKVFLLSARELGQSANSYFCDDGSPLSYFSSASRRIANYEGTAWGYWTRSAYKKDTYNTYHVEETGSLAAGGASSGGYGTRPALILSSNALFDTDTLILKGVA